MPDWRIHASQARSNQHRRVQAQTEEMMQIQTSEPKNAAALWRQSLVSAHRGKHESSCSAKPGRCRACTRTCLETGISARARSRTQAGVARGGRDGRARVLLSLSDSRASVCSAALQALNVSLEKRPEKLCFWWIYGGREDFTSVVFRV